jgi:hypothetical protein
MPRTAADDFSITSVHDALDARKDTLCERERLRTEIVKLEQLSNFYYQLAVRICPHTETYVDTVSAGTPRFRPNLQTAHHVICKLCHAWVDDAPVAPEWYWD